jgi:hypothetical protein
VLSLIILLAGGLALLTLPISQYPEIVPPTVQVTARYQGADPKVIADTVATPIEQEVNGVQDMLYMSSQSTGDGTMTLDVTQIAEIQGKYTTGNTSWFSHKATIRIILCDLLGIDLGRYRDRIDMLSGSVSIVKFDLHGPLLQVLGDRAYMGEKLAMRPGT